MASASPFLSIPLPNGSRISVLLSLPFALIHLASLLIFFMPFHWYYLVACAALLVVRMFFVTAGYHRYFSHRSFKTSRVFQFVIAFMAMTSSQKGVLWWAAHHRHHHRPHQLVPRAAYARRRLAQQSSSLHGLGAPGILLVGDRHHLLHAESHVLARHRLGPP